ncbi:hypothetical protein H4R23_003686, partial [Coemansia sp. Cherry 401B]
MGVFWPLDCPSHVIRLVGLVGVVAGCCAILDRDTRYAMLRQLYAQLKRLDEEAAAQIEADEANASARDKRRLEGLISHGDNANARDTRSFASDSTAFSRAGSPQHHALDTPASHADSEETTQPSQCNTLEGATQLGEALSRLQLQQGARPDRLVSAPFAPSPLSRDTTELPDSRDTGNSEAQPGAVASDEMLLPLTAGNGPPTPQADPAPKVIDTSQRLAPLPNPSAPKIKPTMRDGRPQLFDYTPPLDKLPKPVAPRRERGHVEIETTDHESYGFVSNPSALVPGSVADMNAAAAALPGSAPGDTGDHYLFVC